MALLFGKGDPYRQALLNKDYGYTGSFGPRQVYAGFIKRPDLSNLSTPKVNFVFEVAVADMNFGTSDYALAHKDADIFGKKPKGVRLVAKLQKQSGTSWVTVRELIDSTGYDILKGVDDPYPFPPEVAPPEFGTVTFGDGHTRFKGEFTDIGGTLSSVDKRVFRIRFEIYLRDPAKFTNVVDSSDQLYAAMNFTPSGSTEESAMSDFTGATIATTPKMARDVHKGDLIMIPGYTIGAPTDLLATVRAYKMLGNLPDAPYTLYLELDHAPEEFAAGDRIYMHIQRYNPDATIPKWETVRNCGYITPETFSSEPDKQIVWETSEVNDSNRSQMRILLSDDGSSTSGQYCNSWDEGNM